MPVAIVAREPGDLDRSHGADPTQTHLGHHALKPRPPVDRGGGPTLILIDHCRLVPAQISYPLLHGVLPALTLAVVHE